MCAFVRLNVCACVSLIVGVFVCAVACVACLCVRAFAYVFVCSNVCVFVCL